MTDDDSLAMFRFEARQLAESLEAGLLDLRARPTDMVLIDGVFRDLHTLKGSGGMFGQAEMARFLHDFETTFEAVREGSIAVSDDLIALSLKARDHVLSLLDGRPSEPGNDLLEALRKLVEGNGGTGGPGQGDGADDPRWRLRFRLAPDTLSLGGRPEVVLDDLRGLGATGIRPDLADLPPLEEMAPDRLYLGWEAELPGTVEEAAIREVFLFHEAGLTLELSRTEPVAIEVAEAPETPDPAEPSPAAAEATMMRVSAERLDDMMDRVGELVIAEARLAELASRSGDPQLVAVAEEIQRLATGMRETTMSIRMTPIGSITGRFRRLVHDLNQSLGKAIDLRIDGQETELDKTVIELLADPLLHLIRNAADHGIEAAETRRSMGKPETGTIRLQARYSGTEVVIALSDDGHGLDRARIKARAVERGLLPSEADPEDGELFRLIFEPGFSTAAAVTELSGRGVGMDVVKRTIDQLRGTIEVESEPGHGTEIRMRLPLTLAIIDGLLVEVAGERYTIPLAAVEHIIELPEDRARSDGTTRFLQIRDQLVPFLRMRDLFDSRGDPGPYQKVVVVTSGELRVGLTVDRIIGSSQTVIKQLSPLHAALKTFSGATILGDGTVALILDVPQLVAFGQSLDTREVA
ncbi:chemotaxis protein CheA [Pseudooceanicola sp. LIPI14-2-Ac024]|uniref:chemotaxis protein CheA n=1 Tax=Pseudooceanicola sp. LIPI14-2-Ac024 TaxID=3344875 RepID=UPI0035CED37B